MLDTTASWPISAPVVSWNSVCAIARRDSLTQAAFSYDIIMYILCLFMFEPGHEGERIIMRSVYDYGRLGGL